MARNLLPALPSTSRRHQVADVLRAAIVDGTLRPGDKLTERDLAADLDISRAPIREALRQLEQEGLVVSYPYRGTEVLGISQQEVTEILVPIRLTLERFAVRTVHPLLTEDDFAHLAALVGRMTRLAEAADHAGLADADVEFHRFLITRSGQPHCLQLWNVIEPRVVAQFRRDAPAHPSPKAVADQHARLLEVLRGDDVEAACEAVAAHIHEMPATGA
ncbi:transcriptional regulator, GntR family [Saccharopolyspora kobensis]|uniref:Transcriptional regulator, GntR family n=1 Tax=Saccharopolyspora kobensis TaxID=146035 RepID=A0A1H5ZC36_9PSEU|nr:GntR family transcriptional regulator [Saccharopolyspora kobensis]SEG34059.1 transcriptional regulator, GntR family [Saccharopolyspora kobensis]SFF17136.1 transcriptional regulator, GntR family [Saccharopolyspora kobensis]